MKIRAAPPSFAVMFAAITAVTLMVLPRSIEAQSATLSAPDFNQMCARVVQLMDAGGVAIPDLREAAVPLTANSKAACGEIQLRPGAGQTTYNLLNNLRVYLALADTVPKPYPFPDAARDQLREVRDIANRLDAHFRGLLDQKDADLRSPDRDGVTHFESENGLLPAAGSRRVVFLGDSIFSEWRFNEYYPKEDFVNRAMAGQLSGQLLTRMQNDVVALKPAIVVIEAGSFDVNRGVPLPVIASNLELMVSVAAANNIKVVFASVLPVNDYHKDENPTYERTPARSPAAIRELNEWIQSFCAKKKLGYVDFYSALVDDQGMLAADASDDGLHPNARGYRLMAPVLAAEIDKVFRAAAARPPAPRPASTTPPAEPAASPIPAPAKPSKKK